MPAAPADMVAERRGDRVDLQFTIPNANTDRSKPADIERVDVYGFTGPSSVSDADLLKYGTKVASLDVKRPKDPDDTAQPDEGESEADVEPPEGKGLDQGARAHVEEPLTGAVLSAVEVPALARSAEIGRPLLPPTLTIPARTYVSVGVSTRGRRGSISNRVSIPLLPPPPAPPQPTIEYTASEVTVTWGRAEPAVSGTTLLPSRANTSVPTRAYNVYLETVARGTEAASETKLTTKPTTDVQYVDSKAELGVERCYAVRAVETIGALTLEGARSPVACRMLEDTFPPDAPKGLKAVASEGAISLIWDPNTEKDLAGYIVLRGIPGDAMAPITKSPVTDTTFRDAVQAGVRYAYAVEAVDKSGNRSATSNVVDETAR